MGLFRRELCWVGLVAADATEVLRAIAGRLHQLGLVQRTFEDALLAREEESPTGLPLPGRKLALPHTDPEHVIVPVIACATLAGPVDFGEMGNPTSKLPVELVVVLALADHQSAQRELVRLLERCQDVAFVERLCGSADPDTLCRTLEEVSE